MDYKTLMGYGKKNKNSKKVIKKSYPKLAENLKKEFGPLNEWSETHTGPKRWSKKMDEEGLTEFEKSQLKEVGSGAEYRKYFKDIEKKENELAKSVNNLKKLLLKKGARDEALALSSVYMSHIIKFTKHLKKLTRKLM